MLLRKMLWPVLHMSEFRQTEPKTCCWIYFCSENVGGIAMRRRREDVECFGAEVAQRLREQAKALPPGIERDELIRKARQAETASHLNEWLTSPGLQPPKQAE
jgi:hypothetical protein